MINYRLIRLYANVVAFRGRTKGERRKIRGKILQAYTDKAYTIAQFKGTESSLPDRALPAAVLESRIFSRAQDILFPREVETAEKIMVFVVPEHNEMSGGIFSMFSIANQMRLFKSIHGYEIIMLTRPNPECLTFLRQTCFRNAETVFRFEQLLRCANARDIYMHLPEYASEYLMWDLSDDAKNFLQNLDTLHINLLNQNIWLMPEREKFESLFELTDNVTQSVAHHAYFSQEYTDRYNIPSLLLPAYTDLGEYTPTDFKDKENLIIYSLDDAPHKEQVLERISRELPQYRLLEIRNITFDKYMEYATRCRFSISFGEGFDGYVAQPIHMGGIGLTVYNDEFFPSDHFLNYRNIFKSADDMVENIVDTIRDLAADGRAYTELNRAFCAEYDMLYSIKEYREQVKKLALKQFELLPTKDHEVRRNHVLAS
ncbi:hypothetical protein SAMN05443999_105280 [Roseovarius azorensis]|uniref:Uncharacterized protein n=1 Tax=Roseovarius azorensis TaxID=1287727 RepID=A0A1H7QIF1_9RHOB|nr:hypothetical protein SAMN05443999_105280 [Roseovarius azorensis]